jgi:hypothetical protein
LKNAASLIILLSLFLVGISDANILEVPSAKYPTIQAGIDSAITSDTVLVQPGEYFENLSIETEDIVVGSLFLTTGDSIYKYTTIVNGDKSGPVVTINTNQGKHTLSGFTLKNGYASQGGGILCINSAPTLTHLNIIENEADYGGGIHIKSDYYNLDPATILHVRISHNLSTYDGGGIYCGIKSGPLLEDVKILNNQASRNGGGVFCHYSTRPQLIHTEITGNLASNRGGGIYYADGSGAIIDSSMINRNNASFCGGIYCENYANPTIKNSEINENVGIGIYSLEYTGIKLNNCKILRNTGHGARCSGDGSGFSMNTVLISENAGAGISLGYYGRVGLTNVTIKKNKGTGIYFGVNSSASFSSTNRSSIYHNQFGSGNGRELRSYQAEGIQPNHVNVILDTFTVLIPTAQEAYPLSNFTFDILNEAQIDYKNYYVSTDGNNANSGLSPDQTRKTLSYQLTSIPQDNVEYIVINVAEGIYSPSTNGESFPLYSRPNVTIKGASKESVIIDAEGTERVFRVDRDYFFLQNMTITGGYTSEAGGGVRVGEGSVHLENLSITKNTAEVGGGIYVHGHRNINLKKVDIFENSAIKGGGIFFDRNGTAEFDTVDRCNIFNNNGEERGFDLLSWDERDPEKIINVFVDTFTVVDPGSKYVSPLNHFEMNIRTNKVNEKDFSKIDNGDISRYFFPNSPNPFSLYTNIKIQVPAIKWVNVSIFNIQGQHIKTLIGNTSLQPGIYTLVWNGTDEFKQPVASGIYFCRYTLGEQSKTRKIIYLR